MKLFYGLLIVFTGVGIYFSILLLSRHEISKKAETRSATDISSTVEMPAPESLDFDLAHPSPFFPEGAIQGEYVIHFTDYDRYLEYLEMLSSAGLEPLGKIDTLLSVRVSEDVLSRLNHATYGGEEHFSYRIERPLPPAEINPELLARLRAFGESASMIVGGSVDGDGSGILVAILDSGIEDHSYFKNVKIDSIDLTDIGVSGAGADHGTAVASIVAGAAGVAPAADLLVIRVLDDQGVGSSFDLAEGIVRAVDQGAQIINLSLGVYQDTQVLQEAVRYAQARGVLMVAAAGNDGYDQLPYPAAYSEVLSVTAVDGLGQHAVFSNKSKSIDFAAPGVGIFAAAEKAGAQLFSGTSAAAPFVSGTLATLLSGDSTLSPQEAVNLVENYLDEAGAAGPDSVYGGGLLNWDRLRERTMKDVDDLALADIYLQPDAQPGTMMPIEVIVQNRGTSWLAKGKLTILVGESAPVEFTVGNLAPGHTTTRKVHTQVPAMHSDETLQIAARVLAEGDSRDVRPENNVKAVFFRPVQP